MSRITFVAMLSLILSFIVAPHTLFMAASAQSTSTENTTSSSAAKQQIEALTQPGETAIGLIDKLITTLKAPTAALDIKMAQLSSSNKLEDIATLAYIWGYPLVTMERSFNWFTNPISPPGSGHGPANQIHCTKELVTANDTDVVAPNVDTLYCVAWMDLTRGPLILKVPPIPDRYYTFEFLDAYTNDYAYVGQRATGPSGGIFLIAGPEWQGQVPEGMTKIWSPTNLAWILQRTLVKGPADTPNVNAIQDQYSLTPLSNVVQAEGTTTPSATTTAAINASGQQQSSQAYAPSFITPELQQTPKSPTPADIPTTGIKIYDEIGQAMIDNPVSPPNPVLETKLASIGIGPDKTPSTQANDTIKAALQTGIEEGEKMISSKAANAGTVVNGWLVNAQTGVYGNDYLLRAAVTKIGFGANIAQEAFYPATFTDSQGQPLNGANNYVIHFNPGQIPPVDAFWSITLYNNQSYFVDNPINRYAVGKYTEGLKNNTDGSLDIYIQNASPGADKESNWLPAPVDSFNLLFRMYLPQPQVLNGTWSLPTVQRTGG
jgi:hypothetical protein